MNRNIFSSNNDGWGAIHVRILILKFVLYKRLNIKIIAWYSYQFYYISNGTWSKMTQNSQVNNPFFVSWIVWASASWSCREALRKKKGCGHEGNYKSLELAFLHSFLQVSHFNLQIMNIFYLDAWHSINFAWKIYM